MRATEQAASEPPLGAEELRADLGGTEVLRGVSLELRAGEIIGVLGPSGAGKTTLFRALVGELPLKSGRVVLGGVDVSNRPLWSRARLGLGYVPQTPSVLLDLTVEKNIDTYRRLVGLSEPVHELAERVDLAGRLDVRAGELSGGERRRLEILRGIIANPKVLVCDEPFAGVDPTASHAIGRTLRELADAGAALVMADHRVGEALQICDFAHLLVDGRIEISVEPDQFTSHPAVQRRYLG